jgi:hypothetical protein
MIIGWVGLSVPGLTVWRESLVFIIACSLYANIEASFAAYMSARVEHAHKESRNGQELQEGHAGQVCSHCGFEG